MSACPEIIDLLPCPECGADCELVPGPASGWEFKRCIACGWSRLYHVVEIDEEWCDLGAYSTDSLRNEWHPYMPGDSRLKGLAKWEMPKPEMSTIKNTVDFQRQFLLDVLGYMAPALTALSILYDDDPYIMGKLGKICSHHAALSDKVFTPRKITPLQESTRKKRGIMYLMMMDAFTPPGFREKDKTKEELRQYAWGYHGMLYFWWMTLYRETLSMADAISEAKLGAHLRHMLQSMEALCVRLQSESAVWELDQRVSKDFEAMKATQRKMIHNERKKQKGKRRKR